MTFRCLYADVPAQSTKTAFRERLQKLCQTPRCVSTLFLYLNNFVLPNGDMLLGSNTEVSVQFIYAATEYVGRIFFTTQADTFWCQVLTISLSTEQTYAKPLQYFRV